MRRFLLFVLLYSMFVPSSLLAAQSPWRWTDLSRQIPRRQNRPVWAVAVAHGVTYYTDGLDFQKGGQVRRVNGTSASADLTSSLRRVNMTRVDDIVSDGVTVLFLKNITARNALFEVVSFDGVKFVNRTERLRAWFDPDEGIASVVGNNGAWAFVTTKGKVRVFPKLDDLRSRPTATSGVEPAVPVGDVPDLARGIGYSFRHTSAAEDFEDLPVAVVPFDRGWFIAQRVGSTTTFLSYNSQSGIEDLTERIGKIERLQAIASNGLHVLIAGTNRADRVTDRLLRVSSTELTDLSFAAETLPFRSWQRALIGWNGSSWMIFSGKQLLRFDGQQFTSLGKTRDYFLRLVGAPNGTFFLGGVVSSVSRDEIPRRLMAKLVRVKEAR